MTPRPFPWGWAILSAGLHLGGFAALPGPALPERSDPAPLEVGLLVLEAGPGPTPTAAEPGPPGEREAPVAGNSAPPPPPKTPPVRRPTPPVPAPDRTPVPARADPRTPAPEPPATLPGRSVPADARFQAPPEHRDPPAEVEPVAMRGGLGEKEARDTALAAAPGRPAGFGGATTGPRNVEASASYDENPPPVYPRIARRRGLEGEVWLRVRVSPMGSVLEAEVERSSSHEILDKAALEAVLRWRFLPARLGDTPVEGVVRVPIRFELLPPG